MLQLILHETLSAVADKIEKYRSHKVIFFGDINCNFSRPSLNVSTVKRFVSSKSLLRSWSSFTVDFTYCCHSEDKTKTSVIDHSFWDEDTDSRISSSGVIHLPENISDHEPVYCIIKTSSNVEEVKEEIYEKKKDSNPSLKDLHLSRKTNSKKSWVIVYNLLILQRKPLFVTIIIAKIKNTLILLIMPLVMFLVTLKRLQRVLLLKKVQ